jgi:hypothetical protein
MSGQYKFEWPNNLSIFDMNRLVKARRSGTIANELARLSQKGVKMTPDEAYALIGQIIALSQRLGFYVLDPAEKPEKWDEDGDLPTCVLTSVSATYVDPNDMQRIVALYHGDNLPDYLSDAERQRCLRASRQKPVLVTRCRRCSKRIVITVETAALAILKYELIEKGGVYEPSTLCWDCRKTRNTQQRVSTKSAQPRGLTVPLGQLAQWKQQDKREGQ